MDATQRAWFKKDWDHSKSDEKSAAQIARGKSLLSRLSQDSINSDVCPDQDLCKFNQ